VFVDSAVLAVVLFVILLTIVSSATGHVLNYRRVQQLHRDNVDLLEQRDAIVADRDGWRDVATRATLVAKIALSETARAADAIVRAAQEQHLSDGT
jgi:hypothetical protein